MGIEVDIVKIEMTIYYKHFKNPSGIYFASPDVASGPDMFFDCICVWFSELRAGKFKLPSDSRGLHTKFHKRYINFCRRMRLNCED